jgi:hypothetical protein
MSRGIQIITKPERYWLGCLRVSKFKYRLANIFTADWSKRLFPYVFFISKYKENKIYVNSHKREKVGKLRKNPNYTDFIISRWFFKKETDENYT